MLITPLLFVAISGDKFSYSSNVKDNDNWWSYSYNKADICAIHTTAAQCAGDPGCEWWSDGDRSVCFDPSLKRDGNTSSGDYKGSLSYRREQRLAALIADRARRSADRAEGSAVDRTLTDKNDDKDDKDWDKSYSYSDYKDSYSYSDNKGSYSYSAKDDKESYSVDKVSYSYSDYKGSYSYSEKSYSGDKGSYNYSKADGCAIHTNATQCAGDPDCEWWSDGNKSVCYDPSLKADDKECYSDYTGSYSYS
jgi:hypothetical protein